MRNRWMLAAIALCVAAGVVGAQTLQLRQALAACKFRIVYESYRDGNWELMVMNADGSNQTNITNTPGRDELFPHASPDGKKVVFLLDEGGGEDRTRNVYYMNIDGSHRIKVGENGRQPFWSPSGELIVYAVQGDVKPVQDPFANSGLYFYNIATKEVSQHPNKDISGLLNPCWSPNGNWIVSSVIRAMGFNESIVAFEANGLLVAELIRSCAGTDDLYQCRPDVSPDGRHVAWGTDNPSHRDYMWVEVADVDLAPPSPRIANRRKVAQVNYPLQTYHVDWSPDGKYIVYSQGAGGTRMEPACYVIGRKAKGWDIWICDPSKEDVTVRITRDGLSNKEPDWIVDSEEVDSEK